MRFEIFLFVGTLLLATLRLSAANKTCYNAKTCIHDGKEKCGAMSDGTVRRFIDSCDMKEYNCLFGTDFMKTSLNKCKSPSPRKE